MTEQLRTRATPAEALQVVRRVMTAAGGRVDQLGPATLVAVLGSRGVYRFWGVFGPGAGRLPLEARFDAASAEPGAVIDVRLTSDEGWYLLRTSMADRAYHERFAQILTDLRRAGFGGVGSLDP